MKYLLLNYNQNDLRLEVADEMPDDVRVSLLNKINRISGLEIFKKYPNGYEKEEDAKRAITEEEEEIDLEDPTRRSYKNVVVRLTPRN